MDGITCTDPAWNEAHPFGGNSPAYYYGCGSLTFFEVCLTVTAQGGLFLTGGGGLSTPGVSGGMGFINGIADPSACQVNSFLSGPSVNAGGGIWAGGNAVWGSEGSLDKSAFGHEMGATTPGGGVFQEYSWGLLGNTGTGGCGCG